MLKFGKTFGFSNIHK